MKIQIPVLKPGDSVEVIAPASRCSDSQLNDLKNLLESWQLNCIIDPEIFGKDLFCANSDEMRFRMLKNSLLNSKTKAVICARGGYGSMRLIPELAQLNPPSYKLFIGMSDLTALNLFFMQQWHWPVLHGALARDKFSVESIAAVKAVMFGEGPSLKLIGKPLNDAATQVRKIQAPITGGNLCLVQASMGTSWQIQTEGKIVFLEEVGERGYRVDRMLEHLRQAGIFNNAVAVLFGDFLNGNEPDGSSLVQPVLERFAQTCKIPVVQFNGIGHGSKNLPLMLGISTELQLGSEVHLYSPWTQTEIVSGQSHEIF